MKTIAELAEAHGKNFAEPYQARINFLAGAKAMKEAALAEVRAAESWADVDGRIQKISTEP